MPLEAKCGHHIRIICCCYADFGIIPSATLGQFVKNMIAEKRQKSRQIGIHLIALEILSEYHLDTVWKVRIFFEVLSTNLASVYKVFERYLTNTIV